MTSDAEPRADAQRAQSGALRVDQPHPGQPGDPHTVAERREVRLAAGTGGAEVAPEGDAPAPTVAHSLEQLREHAAQLSDRLSEQQSELDRRESQLTAQEADLEARLQNARGWLEEREQELDRRAEGLTRKEQEATEREEAAQARITQLTEVREQALADRFPNQVRRISFHDRRPAGIDHVHLSCVRIDADDLMTVSGQTASGDDAYVTQSENADSAHNRY